MKLTATTAATRKAKGRRHQQHVAASLQKALGLPPEDVVSRPMGSPGLDVMLSAEARNKFPYGIECKRTEKLSLPAWWAQCNTNAVSEKLKPMLVIRRNGEPALVILKWDDYLEEKRTRK